jgi:hypothetical protein
VSEVASEAAWCKCSPAEAGVQEPVRAYRVKVRLRRLGPGLRRGAVHFTTGNPIQVPLLPVKTFCVAIR